MSLTVRCLLAPLYYFYVMCTECNLRKVLVLLHLTTLISNSYKICVYFLRHFALHSLFLSASFFVLILSRLIFVYLLLFKSVSSFAKDILLRGETLLQHQCTKDHTNNGHSRRRNTDDMNRRGRGI